MLMLLTSALVHCSYHFKSKLGNLVHEAGEQKKQSADPVILEGLKKTMGEVQRDIEPLELTRNEDRATIRELEIGLLKGLFTGSRCWFGGPNA